ncbi:MAG: hypothetical protein ACYDCL_06965 [Myxococcales bacterium]
MRATLLCLLLLPLRAEAMHVSERASVLAWSSDGSAALLLDRRGGPEGGGTISVLRVAATGCRSWELSSNFSPGGGLRPQLISDRSCRAQAKDIAADLRAHGIQGVGLDASACAGNRNAVLQASAGQRVEESAVPSDGAISFRSEGAALELRLAKASVRLALPRAPTTPRLYLSPQHRLLVVLDAPAPGDRLLLAVFASPMGEAQAFAPVTCSAGQGSNAVRMADPPARAGAAR